MNKELPQGWVWTSLGEIISIEYGKGLTEDKRDKNGIYPVYGSSGIVGYHSNYFVEKNCIIIGRKGAVGKVHLTNSPSWPIDTTYYTVPPKNISRVFLFFLLYYLRLDKLDKSTAIPGINRNDVYGKNIPLPPFAEQERIANKIEELFTNLDKGIEYLKTAQTELNFTRQSVLKYAMEGKLTENWREENKGKIELASVLLEKIKDEGKDNIQRYKEMAHDNIKKYTDIPNSWLWVKLIQISDNIKPGFPCGKHNREGKGVPHIRPMNIDIKGGINLSNIKYVNVEEYDSLKKGDVLFNNTNSSELLGKTTYIQIDTNWAYSNHMTRIRINNSIAKSEWISFYLHYLYISGFYQSICIHHVNQSSINSKVLSEKIPIPLPPIAEQKQIVEEIETYYSILDNMENTISQSLNQTSGIRQSILKKAFEGRLVPQDPNDEPASVLLERIKADKSKSEKEKISEKRTDS